jgi:hypothetical protein
MGFFDGIFGSKKPKNTPNLQQQRNADLEAFQAQGDLADFLGRSFTGAENAALTGENLTFNQALAGGETDPLARQLRRKGALSDAFRRDLDRESLKSDGGPVAAALAGGFDPRLAGAAADQVARSDRTRSSRLAGFKAGEQRKDIGQIFGGNLARRAAAARQTSGALKEAAPKRSGFDRAQDSVNRIIGSVFG